MDHQMNMLISQEFGQYFVRLPLKKAANILHGNALTTDWDNLVSNKLLSYIVGNPPFIGHHNQTEDQKRDLHFVLKGIQAAGVMDFVTAWFYKASEYIQNTKIKVAFVSTNSISQGEQVGILWSYLINNFKIKIHFAHRTFKWTNEAKGNAAVYCVIVGFANFDTNVKQLFEYDDIKGEPHELRVKNINPYLVDAKDVLIENRSNPICNIPKMIYGNKPTDGGHFILTDDEKDLIISKAPKSAKYIRPLISAKEFLNNINRWCIWLVGADPSEIKECNPIVERVEAVKKFRSESKAKSTREYKFHSLFRQITQPKSDYLLIPSTTSENRKYIPMGFFDSNSIANNSCHIVPNCTKYHFGILMSIMHMTWVKNICGRLKSDFRYSKDIVYNNFPWPENPTEKQINAIEVAAVLVLEARAKYQKSSLANLYGSLMPHELINAHQQLDKAVELAYRPQPFINETKRMEFLFELYEKYTAGLFAKEKVKKAKAVK
jgi:hypothetical protein